MMNRLTIPLAGGIQMGGWRHTDAWPNAVRDVDRPALFAAIARPTSHIGLVSTMTTTYEQPFSVARRFASLLRPDSVHLLNPVGKHFQVKVPLNVACPPQGHPVIFFQ